jgi:hypothetical protein
MQNGGMSCSRKQKTIDIEGDSKTVVRCERFRTAAVVRDVVAIFNAGVVVLVQFVE